MCPWASLRFVVATSEGLSKASIVGGAYGFRKGRAIVQGEFHARLERTGLRVNEAIGSSGESRTGRGPCNLSNAISYPLNPLAVTVGTALLLGQGVAGGGAGNGETYLGVPKAEVRLRQR